MDKNATKLQIYVDTDKIPSYHPEALFKLARLNWSSIESLDADAISVSKDLHQAWFLNEIKDQRNAGSFLSYFKDKGPKIDKDLRESTCVIDKDLVQFKRAQAKFEEGDEIRYIGTEEDIIDMGLFDEEEQSKEFYNEIKGKVGRIYTVDEVDPEGPYYDVYFNEPKEFWAGEDIKGYWYKGDVLAPELPETIDVKPLEYKGRRAQRQWKVGDKFTIPKGPYPNTVYEIGLPSEFSEDYIVRWIDPGNGNRRTEYMDEEKVDEFIERGMYKLLPQEIDVPELKYKDMDEKKEGQRTQRVWKVGDKFKYKHLDEDRIEGLIYTISAEAGQGFYRVEWDSGFTLYDESRIDDNFAIGRWIFIEPPELDVRELEYKDIDDEKKEGRKAQREWEVGDQFKSFNNIVGTIAAIDRYQLYLIKWGDGDRTWERASEIDRLIREGAWTVFESPKTVDVKELKYKDIDEEKREDKSNGPGKGPEVTEEKVERSREAQRELKYKGYKKVDWKIGDRIKTTDMYEGEVPKGTSGTVINVSERYFDVKWDTGPTYPTTYSYHYPERFELVPSTVDVRPLEYKGQYRFKVEDRVKRVGKLGFIPNGTIGIVDEIKGEDVWVRWEGRMGRKVYSYLLEDLDSTEVLELMPDIIDVPDLPYIESQLELRVGDRIKRKEGHGTSVVKDGAVGKITDIFEDGNIRVLWEDGTKTIQGKDTVLFMNEIIEPIIDVPELEYKDIDEEKRESQKIRWKWKRGDKLRRTEDRVTDSKVPAGILGTVAYINSTGTQMYVRWDNDEKKMYNPKSHPKRFEPILDVPSLEYKGQYRFKVEDRVEVFEIRPEFQEYLDEESYDVKVGDIGTIINIEHDLYTVNLYRTGLQIEFDRTEIRRSKPPPEIVDVRPLEYKGRKVQANFDDFRQYVVNFINEIIETIPQDELDPHRGILKDRESIKKAATFEEIKNILPDDDMYHGLLESYAAGTMFSIPGLKYRGKRVGQRFEFKVGDKVILVAEDYVVPKGTKMIVVKKMKDVSDDDIEMYEVEVNGFELWVSGDELKLVPPDTIDVKELKYRGQKVQGFKYIVGDRFVNKQGTIGRITEIDPERYLDNYKIYWYLEPSELAYDVWTDDRWLDGLEKLSDTIDVPPLEYKGQAEPKYDVGDKLEFKSNIYHTIGAIKERVRDSAGLYRYFIEWKDSEGKDMPGGGWSYERHLKDSKHIPVPSTIDVKELEYKGQLEEPRFEVNDRVRMVDKEYGVDQGIPSGTPGTVLEIDSIEQQTYYRVRFDGVQYVSWYKSKRLGPVPPEIIDVPELEYKDIDEVKESSKRKAGTWELPDTIMKANALKRLIDSIKSDDVYKTEWVQDKLGSVYGDDSLYDDLDGNSHGEDEAREIDGGIAKDVIIENLRSTLDYYKESPEQFKKEFAPDALDVLHGIVGLPSGFKELKYKGQVEPKFKKRDKVRTLIDAHSSVEPDPTPKGSIGGVRDVGIFNQKFICYVTFEDGESYWFYESDLEFFGPETIDVPPLEYKE